MKKFFAISLGLAAMLGLASCSNSNNDSRDLSANDAIIAEQWGLDAENYFNMTYQPEDKSTSYYEVETPANLEDSIRLVTVSLEDYKNDWAYYNTSYLSTSNLAAVYQGYAITALDNDKQNLQNGITGIGSSLNIQTSWSFTACQKSDIEGLTNPELCILYMPVRLTYHTVSKKGDDQITLFTYVFAPVYTATSTVTDNVYSDSIINHYADKKITIRMNGTVVA